jgi:hypothetical protein
MDASKARYLSERRHVGKSLADDVTRAVQPARIPLPRKPRCELDNEVVEDNRSESVVTRERVVDAKHRLSRLAIDHAIATGTRTVNRRRDLDVEASRCHFELIRMRDSWQPQHHAAAIMVVLARTPDLRKATVDDKAQAGPAVRVYRQHRSLRVRGLRHYQAGAATPRENGSVHT